MRHIIPISGKDSLTTYIVQNELKPFVEYETIFNDTSLELPETYQWLEKIEDKLKIKIKRIGKDLNEIIAEQGILPSPKARYCTRLSKIYPMEDYLKHSPAMVYFGIRADEKKRLGYRPTKRANITPQYPLVELGIGINEVYKILDKNDLMPPTFFWAEIFNRVERITGKQYINKLSRFEFDYLFSWRSRPNCYNCFFQRQYEFIGLHDHHPNLFFSACELEDNTGADGYTLRQGYKLKDLLGKRELIIKRRVKDIVKIVMKKSQLPMFEQDSDIALTSCGIFCGK